MTLGSRDLFPRGQGYTKDCRCGRRLQLVGFTFRPSSTCNLLYTVHVQTGSLSDRHFAFFR